MDSRADAPAAVQECSCSSATLRGHSKSSPGPQTSGATSRATTRRLITGTLLGTGLVLATACDRPDQDAELVAEPTTSETLLAQPPPDWLRSTATTTPGLRLTEYRPPAPPADGWDDRMRFEASSGTPMPDPIQVALTMAEEQRKNCEGFEDHNTFSGFENGYPTSVRLLLCREDKRTGKALVTLVKAIQGNDFFYLIVRSRSAPPPDSGLDLISQAEIGGWSLHMRTIGLCDKQRADHPCPRAE